MHFSLLLSFISSLSCLYSARTRVSLTKGLIHLAFSLQLAGQRNFSVQFLKWRSHANGGWGSILRSRSVICLMAASALTHMDLSRRIYINATVLSESFLLWWQRGTIFSLSIPFSFFHCLFLPSALPHIHSYIYRGPKNWPVSHFQGAVFNRDWRWRHPQDGFK